MELWALRGSEVARVDGIGLADVRGHPRSFRATIERALALVRDHDPRRYARIASYIAWIVNRVTNSSMGMEYDYSIRACNLEFSETLGPDLETTTALYACGLVHEATHGLLESRGIQMRPHNRIRIERLCTKEQNRFAAKLTAAEPERYPRESIHMDFRAGYWHSHWAESPLSRRASLLRRWLAD